jgi:K+-transporting ATPase KdpF subunit
LREHRASLVTAFYLLGAIVSVLLLVYLLVVLFRAEDF